MTIFRTGSQKRSLVLRRYLFVSFVVVGMGFGCDERSVGGSEGKDGGIWDSSVPDGQVTCDPGPTDLDCVEIVFPPQPTSFTQS